MRAVGEWTYAGRSKRAERHFAIAARHPERSTMHQWHDGRARGQLERIERVEACGTEHYQLACKSCGVVAPGVRERTCASWRYCVVCRGTRARQYRERVDESRAHWLKHKRAFERERFLTLTLPHAAGVGRDVKSCIKGWERFTRSLRRWVVARHSAPLLAFVRALEIGPSGGGHAHMHAWIGAPYLPEHVLRVLWGRALDTPHVPVRPIAEVLADLPDERSRAELLKVAGWRGKPACDGGCYLRRRRCTRRHFVPWPIVNIKLAYGEVGNELVKYLLKDVDQGELVDPLMAANFIEASEGVRVVAASRGFWVLALKCCEHCDEPACWMVVAYDGEPERAPNAARGPPSLRSYSGDNSAEVAGKPPKVLSSREVVPEL